MLQPRALREGQGLQDLGAPAVQVAKVALVEIRLEEGRFLQEYLAQSRGKRRLGDAQDVAMDRGDRLVQEVAIAGAVPRLVKHARHGYEEPRVLGKQPAGQCLEVVVDGQLESLEQQHGGEQGAGGTRRLL